MKGSWIEAGFFLVSPGKAPASGGGLLPPRILTISTCVAESYPDVWALPWAETPALELRRIRAQLALEESGFADLCAWVRRSIDAGEFGWPNVFLSLRAAQEFEDRYLGAVEGVRRIGLSLTKDAAAGFLRDLALQSGGAASGVWTALSRNRPLERTIAPIGFDVLGAEYGGSFHTFSCNALERPFAEELGVHFNEHGLIDGETKAAEACAYANSDDAPAEPVPWYAFRVDEYGDEHG
ncbi:MAG TPA: hypothetical protein VGR31_12870 [Planctomycetota bacterium]|jgi:hypothetical protein|nr:hypothetical protein [Planctomycetota bacterium]